MADSGRYQGDMDVGMTTSQVSNTTDMSSETVTFSQTNGVLEKPFVPDGRTSPQIFITDSTGHDGVISYRKFSDHESPSKSSPAREKDYRKSFNTAFSSLTTRFAEKVKNIGKGDEDDVSSEDLDDVSLQSGASSDDEEFGLLMFQVGVH